MQGPDVVDAVLEATPETPSYMIGIRENVITRVPLMDAVAQVRSTSRSSDLLNLMIGLQTRSVADAIETKDFERAMHTRDPEFKESLQGLFYTANLPETEKELPKENLSGSHPCVCSAAALTRCYHAVRLMPRAHPTHS